mmetsp:Transcript_41821/g.69650  ORF Transcript_41821/g.69650 Transcript_41821/m.69650 type:complete len:169 (-) Transcript_41821:615-1121(-)
MSEKPIAHFNNRTRNTTSTKSGLVSETSHFVDNIRITKSYVANLLSTTIQLLHCCSRPSCRLLAGRTFQIVVKIIVKLLRSWGRITFSTPSTATTASTSPTSSTSALTLRTTSPSCTPSTQTTRLDNSRSSRRKASPGRTSCSSNSKSRATGSRGRGTATTPTNRGNS